MSSRVKSTLQVSRILLSNNHKHKDCPLGHDVFTQKYAWLQHLWECTNTPEHTNTDTHMHKHRSRSWIRLTWTAVRVGRSACTGRAGPGHQLIPTLAPKLSWPELNYPNCPEKYTAPKILIMILLSRIRSTIFHETSHQIIMHNCSLPESSLSNRCHLSY